MASPRESVSPRAAGASLALAAIPERLVSGRSGTSISNPLWLESATSVPQSAGGKTGRPSADFIKQVACPLLLMGIVVV